MASKILLLKVSANASLLECKCTAQEFIIAADAVFFKAQGLATLAPLHKTAFGLLKGLLDDWLKCTRHPCNKDKGKAKAMEDDKDKEGEATKKLRTELENFMVPTKFTAAAIRILQGGNRITMRFKDFGWEEE
ncbi:hypothetical protein C0995_010974 [Termitomyces sp. Mi166|nr:hypothetical protein C0995_010974 [Termitomyces sp. Mi166\